MRPDPDARTRGPGPRVLVVSRPDSASVTIGRHVRTLAEWVPSGHVVDGHEVLRSTDEDGEAPLYLATIDDWHIRREGLGEILAGALEAPIEAVLVLSRHRAASGQPSFTAHPVGNPTAEAIAGGAGRTPTPTHPGLLSACYRALVGAAKDAALPHAVTFEATHHGPLSAVPIVFIEIGSDERHWTDDVAGDVVARASLAAARGAPTVPPATVMAIGGGHYAPRFGPLVGETRAAVGHMLAAYHWVDREGLDRDTLAAFYAASAPPGQDRPDGVYFDHKSLPGPARAEVRDHLEALGIPRLRTADLPGL